MTFESARPAIELRNVDVRFNELVYGLRGASLTVQRGEFVFLCGPTGSGKSTILKVLTREARHTRGQVLLDGQDLGALGFGDIPRLRRKMGIVPQDYALLPNKRVWENVGYAMRAVGATKREARRAIPELLERVNVAHRADAYPHELSGGEQQRVAIARALINNPPLLLADEPTGNLDPQNSQEIIDLLLQLNLKGATVVVATHDMPVVERAGQRVVSVSHGKVVEPGVLLDGYAATLMEEAEPRQEHRPPIELEPDLALLEEDEVV